MNVNAEERCLLWLSAAEITAGRVDALIAEHGSAQGIWDAFQKPQGPRFAPQSLRVLEGLHSQTAMDELIARMTEKHVRVLFRTDPHYPEQLAAIQDPPYALYYAGDLRCLDAPMVAVVGSRRASNYGREMAHMLATGLCGAGVCVVSGLARGIDAAAHQGALDAGGRTVGVLGSGINMPYPPEHTLMLRQIAGGNGLILSEYPLDAEPIAFHFPHRNRVISGLRLGVVFVEGCIKSGGMLTVGTALAQGREVFAVPGRVGTAGVEGPHTILREGARVVTCAGDVLEDLGLVEPAPAAPGPSLEGLTQRQRAIVSALMLEPMDVTELARQTGLDDEALVLELSLLRINGIVVQEAGNRFGIPIGK